MPLWFSEEASPGHRLEWKVRRVLYSERSPYQEIMVLDTEQYGPSLILDGIMQTTAGDEYIYHEMLAMVPLSVHPHPSRILVIGGGDGGLVREVLKFSTVTEVVLVEIDRRVVEVAKRFLPSHTTAFSDPRLTIRYQDGAKFLRSAAQGEGYDVILVDSTDPEGNGPGRFLYAEAFRRDVRSALRPEGIFAQQTGTPFYNPETLREVSADVARKFPVSGVYWCTVPTYPGGLFTFVSGSLSAEITEPRRSVDWPCRWYSPEIHRAAFVLPPMLEELVGKKG